MSIENKFGFIGWSTEGTSDKIWGFFFRPTSENPTAYRSYWRPNDGQNVVVFWGRRGKAMQFKADVYGYALERLRDSKTDPRKGYKEIDEAKLMVIWPNFIEEAEAKLMWDVLAGKVK